MGFLKKTLSRNAPDKKDKDAEKRFNDPSPERSPPPSYRPVEPADEPLASAVRKLTFKDRSEDLATVVPTNDECIAHLKLLTAFAHLREEISETPDLFDLRDGLIIHAKSSETDDQDHTGIIKIREKRWAVYAARTVDRFTKWWQTVLPGRGQYPTLLIHDLLDSQRLSTVTDTTNKMKWSTDKLPPLDVLMVLHSFMLNPRNFLEDCLRYDMMPLWNAGFPWELVNAAIDSATFDYNPGEGSVSCFEQSTKHAWDNLSDPAMRKVSCSNCQKKWDRQYTNAAFGPDVKFAFENSAGFTDKAFEMHCTNCGSVTNHDALVLNKFRRDLELLIRDKVPMPGTILSIDGAIETTKSGDMYKNELLFPCRLLATRLSDQLLHLTDPANNKDGEVTFNDVRKAIEGALKDRSILKEANGSVFALKTLKLKERIAVRRMMSRYWENSSPFALDLVGAVLRQGIFVQKMKEIDWIHSPALESTMGRLVAKYQVFFKIIVTNPGQVAVPTLDVDLAWHTHQLTPLAYYQYSMKQTFVKYIDHDDKIDESKLSTSFEWTSYQYQKLTGEAYSECTCWYCEAIREANSSRSLFSSSRSRQMDLYDRPNISSDPRKNPHISAHNAVKNENLAAGRIAAAQWYKLEADYQRAAKRATKAGKRPQDRNAYADAYVWGKQLCAVWAMASRRGLT